LKSAEKPRFPGVIRLLDVSQADIEKEIAELDERSLIFWEDDRFISLVFAGSGRKLRISSSIMRCFARKAGVQRTSMILRIM
jgi:hypothetical protein